MNFKKVALIAAIVATSSVAMAGEGFYAGVGVSAVGSSFNRIETGANLDMNTGATSTVGVIDVGYSYKVNKDWSMGVGATYDMGKAKAGYVDDTDLDLHISTKNHYSVYVQPSFNLNANTAVFGKVGYHSIKLEVFDGNDVGGNDSQTLHGVGYGFGVRTMATKNIYVQAEVQWVDYKAKTDAVDTNKLKTTSGIITVGYQY